MSDAFKEFRKEKFPKVQFTPKTLKYSGFLFKKGAVEESEAYLREHLNEGNLQPIARFDVLAVSRPFAEWPIMQVSAAIQEYVYGLTEDERLKEGGIQYTEDRLAWFTRTGVNHYGYTSAQGLNKIFKLAFNIYDSVPKRLTTNNKKAEKRAERINAKRLARAQEPIEAKVRPIRTEDGHLAEKPGINPLIHGYQQVKFRAVDPVRDRTILAPIFPGYTLDPEKRLPIGKGANGSSLDRLLIPPGMPGYVPEWDRAKLNPNKKRVRRRYDKREGAILAIMTIGSDWALFDIRGLLRNVRWRFPPNYKLTPSGLLRYFTDSPTIDPRPTKPAPLGTATLRYMTGSLPGRSVDVLKVKQIHQRGIYPVKAPCALLNIDLGVTNPIAAKLSYLAPGQEPVLITRYQYKNFSVAGRDEIRSHRESYDALMLRLREAALAEMTPEEQAEIHTYHSLTAEIAKENIARKYGIDPSRIPWDKVTSTSTYIANEILKGPHPEEAKTLYKTKTGKEQVRKRQDAHIAFYDDIRQRMSKATREKFEDLKQKHLRGSSDFEKLAKRKEQLAQRMRNDLLQKAQAASGLDRIIVNIEDLNVNGKMFSGKGKRFLGWDHLFQPKKEGRWFMKALFKAFLELGPNRGIQVALSPAYRTSITCTAPGCGYVDAKNRDGEHFHCLACGLVAHADVEIATDNLERVFITGQAMPKAPARAKAPKKSSEGARKAEEKEKTPDSTDKPCDTTQDQGDRSQTAA